jgi:hypothetical protein
VCYPSLLYKDVLNQDTGYDMMFVIIPKASALTCVTLRTRARRRGLDEV